MPTMPTRNGLASSVGRKVVIGVTGLALFVFLILHLAGNLIIFAGAPAFNHYSDKLTQNKPLLYGGEIALLGLFLIHVFATVVNAKRNRDARPVAYAEKRLAGPPSRKGLASSTMIYTGALVLLFAAIHLRTFKWGAWYPLADGTRDLARLEFEIFSSPLVVAFYVLAMVVLGLHLRHGVSSAFQSLGADHPAVTPKLLRLGLAAAVGIALGFALIPVAVYALGGRS